MKIILPFIFALAPTLLPGNFWQRGPLQKQHQSLELKMVLLPHSGANRFKIVDDTAIFVFSTNEDKTIDSLKMKLSFESQNEFYTSTKALKLDTLQEHYDAGSFDGYAIVLTYQLDSVAPRQIIMLNTTPTAVKTLLQNLNKMTANSRLHFPVFVD